jgi:hypothetical protein
MNKLTAKILKALRRLLQKLLQTARDLAVAEGWRP